MKVFNFNPNYLYNINKNYDKKITTNNYFKRIYYRYYLKNHLKFEIISFINPRKFGKIQY
jgi:hypothetical protein